MSLSSRFTHPFERWMNNLVRREMDSWRTPGKGKGGAKSLSRSSLRPTNEWALDTPMGPWASRWTEPWLTFEEPWYAEAPWVQEQLSQPWMQSHTTENEKGQLELRARMPQGIEKGDIHLDFEEGGLRMSATKSHQQSRKLHHGQGSSMHKSHVSVSHYWPLEKGITEKDITANFIEDQGLLEITVNQPLKLQNERSKALPITIGTGSTKSSYQMLDQSPTAGEIMGSKSGQKVDASDTSRSSHSDQVQDWENPSRETSDAASAIWPSTTPKTKASNLASSAASFTHTFKDTASEMKDATIDTAKNAGQKLKDFAGEAGDTAKSILRETSSSKASPASKSSKDMPKKPVVGPDAPQVPTMDEM